jgi:hypothetical protein
LETPLEEIARDHLLTLKPAGINSAARGLGSNGSSDLRSSIGTGEFVGKLLALGLDGFDNASDKVNAAKDLLMPHSSRRYSHPAKLGSDLQLRGIAGAEWPSGSIHSLVARKPILRR